MSKKPRKKKDAVHGADRQWAERVARRMGAIVQKRPLPEGKISDIVVSFAEPLLDAFVESDEDQVEVLTFACLLWNLVFIRERDRKLYANTETQVMTLLSGTPYFLGPAQALNLLTAMMKRWEEDFSWCRRMIVDKQIAIEKNRVHLSIISAPVPGSEEFDTASGPEMIGNGTEAGEDEGM